MKEIELRAYVERLLNILEVVDGLALFDLQEEREAYVNRLVTSELDCAEAGGWWAPKMKESPA